MIQRVKSFPQKLTEDFSYKSVALAVALVLWVTMLGRKDITVSRRIPIQILNAPNVEVEDATQREVEVEVMGPRMALKKFTQLTNEVYTLDVTDLKAGSHTVRLTRDGLFVPVGVKVVALRPDELTVQLTPVTSRNQ